MITTLTISELRIAAHVEIERRTQNLANGARAKYGLTGDSWTIGIEGAAAEMALAKQLNRYWSGAIGDLHAKDVGRIQVRATPREDGCLLLHVEDSDGDVFVLAVGTAPTFDFRGWIRARDGKREEYWRDPVGGRPAYFVPQSTLRPMPENGQ